MKLQHLLWGLLLSCTDRVATSRPSLRMDTEEHTSPESGEGSIFEQKSDGATSSPQDGGTQRNPSPDAYSSQPRYDGATSASDSSLPGDSSISERGLDAVVADAYIPSSECPYTPYSGSEVCDGIDNDGDGLIDRALFNGETNPLYSQRICPVRCYTTDTHITQEFVDHQDDITSRLIRSDFCREDGTWMRYRCGWDGNCIGEWAFLYAYSCENLKLQCIDPDGAPDLSIEDQSENLPAYCNEL